MIKEQPASLAEKASAPSPVKWRNAYALVPIALAIVTSINTLWNHFASDDLEQVLNNAFIKRFSNLPAAFTTSVWSFAASDIVFTVDSYFRPLFSCLFTINYAWFGTVPWGWHLMNVLIHATATLLVFVVSREVTSRPWVATVAASLFAVHPVHSESVAWVSGVTDPLMALFLLPAFYFYLRYRKEGRRVLLGMAVGLYFLALLSKETALALPLVVAYCELVHFKAQESSTQRAARLSILAGSFALPTVIYFLMRYQAISRLVFGGQARYPLVPGLLTVPLATAKYIGLMFIPFGYSYQHYTAFVEKIDSVSFLAPLAGLIAIAIAILLLRSRLVTFAAVWFITMLAPALASLRQFEPAYLIQERYLYVSSVGVCLALALGVEWLSTRQWLGPRRVVVAASLTVFLVIAWSAVYVRQNRVWYDSVTVYQNSKAVAPSSPVARVYLSRTYFDAGRPREAEAEVRGALDLDSSCAPAYLNLSYFAKTSGKLDKACEYLENGISAVSLSAMTRHDLATMHLNLGLLYGQRKMFEQCEQNLLRSIEISPRPAAWYYTGQFYFDQGRFDEALEMYQKTLEQVPGWFAPIHLKLGFTYEALRDLSRAESQFNQYLLLAPDAPDREDVKNHITSMKRGAPRS